MLSEVTPELHQLNRSRLSLRLNARWPPYRHFKLEKRGQFFLRVRNVTLSIAAMCVCNPDRSPFMMSSTIPAQILI
jgi:hypothetical protein